MKVQGQVTGIALLVPFFALIGPHILSWLSSKVLDGLYEWIVDFEFTALPWHHYLAILSGIAGGVFLLLAFGTSQSVRLLNLANRASNFVVRVRDDRALESFRQGHSENLRDLAFEGISLELLFRKEALTTPQLQTTSPAKVCISLETYFPRVIPFMRDGHIAELKRVAPHAAAEAAAFAEKFDPESWFLKGGRV